jgi:mRNA-degrading endonuclease toxin of MazEF toxin-antitoxin module
MKTRLFSGLYQGFRKSWGCGVNQSNFLAAPSLALLNKIRMLDLAARKARKIEKVPQVVVDDALERLQAIVA